jgi:hypothetical protein
MRRASAFADAKGILRSFGVQADRGPKAFTPIEIGLPRRSAFADAAQADRGPKALTPIEIGLSGRCAPGVGLCRRKGGFFGRRRPTVGRRAD